MGHGGQVILGKVLGKETSCSEKTHLYLFWHPPLGQTHLPIAQRDLKDIGVSPAVASTLLQPPPSPEHSCSQAVPEEQPESITWQQSPILSTVQHPRGKAQPQHCSRAPQDTRSSPKGPTAPCSWARQLTPEEPSWKV